MKIVIEVRGGCVCEIWASNKNVDAVVIDHDNDGRAEDGETTDEAVERETKDLEKLPY
jgi:hypothetical protein